MERKLFTGDQMHTIVEEVESADVFAINLFKRLFQEHYQNFKWFGSRSGPTLCMSVMIWVQTVCKVL